jgi:hypothetical protein
VGWGYYLISALYELNINPILLNLQEIFHLELEILSVSCSMGNADSFSAILVKKRVTFALIPGIDVVYHP